jgi:hypothetical protein
MSVLLGKGLKHAGKLLELYTYLLPNTTVTLHRIQVRLLLGTSLKELNFVKKLKFQISQSGPIHPTLFIDMQQRLVLLEVY